MNPAALPEQHATSGQLPADELAAYASLLRREFSAVMKIGDVLRKAIEEEHRLGLDVCTGPFEVMLQENNAALRALVREFQRVDCRLESDRSEGAAVPSSH